MLSCTRHAAIFSWELGVGIFCASIILKGPDAADVRRELRARDRLAWISQTTAGVTVVFDNEYQGEKGVIWRRFEIPDLYRPGETAWEPLVRDLSGRFGCIAFAMEIHDSDYLYYELSDAGRLMDEYISEPDPFGWVELYGRDPLPNTDLLSRPMMHHADLLCRAFGIEEATEQVAGLLGAAAGESAIYGDVIDQFRALTSALQLPSVAGFGKTVPVDGYPHPAGLVSTMREGAGTDD
jgi:hypothetical protein